MKNLLQARHRNRLRALLEERPLIAFDFDGTLAPIVDQPAKVRMRARTAKLLAKVAEKYPVAVVSGRSRADVMAHTEGRGVEWWIGNHGSDWGAPSRREAGWNRQVARWKKRLERALAGADGIELEDKGHSLSVHYRHAKDPRAGERRIFDEASRLPGCRMVGGKCVVNLVPASAPHKGDALLKLLKKSGSRSAIFLGDDVTDEDAFVAAKKHRGVVGVRVGLSQKSAAPFGIPNQASIDSLLALILELS